MAPARMFNARAVPAMLAAGFALLAVAMIGIHQQGRAVSLLQTRARRASLHAKMDSFFSLLKHPVRSRPVQKPLARLVPGPDDPRFVCSPCMCFRLDCGSWLLRLRFLCLLAGGGFKRAGEDR